jgi:hypothetical protein
VPRRCMRRRCTLQLDGRSTGGAEGAFTFAKHTSRLRAGADAAVLSSFVAVDVLPDVLACTRLADGAARLAGYAVDGLARNTSFYPARLNTTDNGYLARCKS